MRGWRQKLKRLAEHPLTRVGPGLITGVADDDPSGIATYSQAGAQFGLSLLWTMPFAYPLMSAVQVMCGRIGRVTGKGLAANMRSLLPPFVLVILVALLLIANTFNIAADIAAMGEVAEMLTGIDRHPLTVGFALFMLVLQIFVPYHRYVTILKWLTLSLLAYPLVLAVTHVPWADVLRHTLLPNLHLDRDQAAMVVAIFGTTISPYLFFWQASEEIEDMQGTPGARPLIEDATAAPGELHRIAWDTWSGMFYSDLVSYVIILATAVTLHAAGVTHIETAAEASQALRPIAGPFAAWIFALGILGVGLIGVPVLAGSAGYAVSEAMGWRFGLERKAKDARGFYAIISVSVFAALLIQYSPLTPMRALVLSAIINGIVAVPLMAVVIFIAGSKRVMGRYVSGRIVTGLGWIATLFMALAAVRMLPIWGD